MDFDGDGDRDFCRPVGQRVTTSMLFCTLWTPTGFGATIASGLLDSGYGTDRAWVDHNGDGKADYCRRVGGVPDGMRVACTISNGTTFGPLPETSAPPIQPPAPGPRPGGAAALARPRIVVTLAYDYSAGRTSTLLRRLTVKGVPRGADRHRDVPEGLHAQVLREAQRPRHRSRSRACSANGSRRGRRSRSSSRSPEPSARSKTLQHPRRQAAAGHHPVLATGWGHTGLA